ncbi:MAG: hypothetical protein WDW38_000708 [Sanguina aurantia]
MAAPVLTSKPLLLTSFICPFVQRVRIPLNHKKVDFSTVEIDLTSKPAWFPQISPLGKVPVMTWSEGGKVQTVYESLISNEFLEDAYPSPAMLPSTPLERAHARIIIGRFDSQFVPAFYKLLRSATREEAVETSAVLVKEVEFLQNNISPTGPYLMGAELTLVDAAVIPFFIRLCVVKHYRGFDLAAKFNPRLASAFESCLKHESVASSMYLLEGATDFTAELIKAYKNYGKEPVDYFN